MFLTYCNAWSLDLSLAKNTKLVNEYHLFLGGHYVNKSVPNFAPPLSSGQKCTVHILCHLLIQVKNLSRNFVVPSYARRLPASLAFIFLFFALDTTINARIGSNIIV